MSSASRGNQSPSGERGRGGARYHCLHLANGPERGVCCVSRAWETRWERDGVRLSRVSYGVVGRGTGWVGWRVLQLRGVEGPGLESCALGHF